jgi:hypothetical protein
MAKQTTKRRPPVKKARSAAKPAAKPKPAPARLSLIGRLRRRAKDYLARRPHRSFQLSRRRDYVRSLNLPGYWAFSFGVGSMLWRHKRLFGSLILLYTVLSALFVGLASQETYQQLASLLNESGKTIFSGGWGELGKAALLVTSGLSGTFAPQLNDVQQVYAAFFGLLTWLTAVWSLRSILTGRVPRLRDALYSAGSPIVPTTLVLLTLLVQLIPFIFSVVVIATAGSTGLLANPFLSMVFWLGGLFMSLISLYWIIGSLVALVVVTLPGMYPWQALRAAGDLVIGRRLRLLLRMLWLGGSIVVGWLLIVIPAVLLDNLITGWWPAFGGFPLIPLVIALVSSAAIVWASAYLFLLYRKVVDDDARPA